MPLTWLIAMHAASIIQACFCGAALQEKQQKPQCVWQHLCGVNRGELLEGPDRSTSELTVYLHVHRLTSGLKCKGARVMAVTGQEADERVGEECAIA